MAGKLFTYTWAPTTSGGSASTTSALWGALLNGSALLNHLFVKPTLPATMFNFKLTSPDGNIVLNRKNITTELNESPGIGMRGLYALMIENSDPNDTFACEFVFEEKKDG